MCLACRRQVLPLVSKHWAHVLLGRSAAWRSLTVVACEAFDIRSHQEFREYFEASDEG